MRQMRGHFSDRSLPAERMPRQQWRLALLEKGQLKNGWLRSGGADGRNCSTICIKQQSTKNVRVSVAVRKELLSLRHRFGERTSCEGRLTTQFRLVNSGKILSRDERRQMSAPYYYRAWTAFPHFLIRFTRAIQRNEKSWDALFLYALAVAPLRVIDSLRIVESDICEERSNLKRKLKDK